MNVNLEIKKLIFAVSPAISTSHAGTANLATEHFKYTRHNKMKKL